MAGESGTSIELAPGSSSACTYSLHLCAKGVKTPCQPLIAWGVQDMSVYWALVITSDRVKREPERDMITPLVKDMLDKSGHSLVYRTIVGNSFAEILHGISNAMLAGADIILVTGGTGPNPRDISVDIVSRLADRELPGIGEEFRRRSIARKVKNAVMSRASAYIVDGRLVVVSPGNPDAVETMMGVLLDVADHLVEQLHGKKHH